MAYVNTYDDAMNHAPARGESGLAALVARLRARLDEHRRYVRTRDELMALSDRELADVGLSRDRIDEIARHSARIPA